MQFRVACVSSGLTALTFKPATVPAVTPSATLAGRSGLTGMRQTAVSRWDWARFDDSGLLTEQQIAVSVIQAALNQTLHRNFLEGEHNQQ